MTARQAAEKATGLAPRDGAGWVLLGYVCHRQKDTASARKALESALRLDPDDPLAHCLTGRICESAGRRNDAVSHYNRALAADPQCEWARQLLAAADADQAPR